MRFAFLSAAILASGCSLYLDDDHPPVDPPPPTPLPRCAPAPASRASQVAPALRDWILEAEGASCALERRTSGGAGNGFPTTLDLFAAPGTETCDAEGCWTALPAFAKRWSNHLPPAAFTWRNEPLGEQWVGMVQAERNAATGELRATLTAMEFGSSALRRYDRRWDRDGHLLLDRESFSGQRWFTTINTWAGDHLVAARFVDEINGTGDTEFAWSWDGANLTGASAHHLPTGARATSRLDYDGAGHLTSIVRTLDGEPWAHQTWSYAGDALVRATTEVSPLVNRNANLVADADTLAPVTFAGAQGEWDVADGLVATTAGCALLPHGLQHGYPEADGAYALGWRVGDRPSGIDGDYGFGNVYDTGMERWFGHDRVEAYTFLHPWSEVTVTGELVYDDRGRMIVEHVTTDDGTIDSVRTRDFDGARLVSDQRVLRRDGDTLATALAFEHDDDGRLTARTYRLDGAIAGRHTWRYDGATVARHTIESSPPMNEPGRSFTIPIEPLGPLGAPVVHERVARGDEEVWERDGVPGETRRYDDAGRLIARTIDTSWEQFRYDADGALGAYAAGYEPTPYTTLSYEHDPAGRLTARAWSYQPNDNDRDVFRYTCR